jgi:hypothetical protein
MLGFIFRTCWDGTAIGGLPASGAVLLRCDRFATRVRTCRGSWPQPNAKTRRASLRAGFRQKNYCDKNTMVDWTSQPEFEFLIQKGGLGEAVIRR